MLNVIIPMEYNVKVDFGKVKLISQKWNDGGFYMHSS
jgi:hypothetical protein